MPLQITTGNSSSRSYGRLGRSLIITPSITSPNNGATGIGITPSFTSSAYNTIGMSESHVSSDWQVASDSGFNTIVASTTNDTTNKTSWTASSFSLNTTYYVRVRYKSQNFTSLYSDAVTFTIRQYYDYLVNGTTNRTGGLFTVPPGIGRLRVTSYGDNASSSGRTGGTASATFDVIPGEVFRIDGHSGGQTGDEGGRGGTAYSFGPNTGSPNNQSSLWLIAGASGAPNASSDNGGGWAGGSGGGPDGQPAAGGGGSQSSGGNGYQPGGALYGGQGRPIQDSEEQWDGGGGGSGWFGGGGAAGYGGGGGGSGRVQIPGPRNGFNITNTQGGNPGGGYVKIEY